MPDNKPQARRSPPVMPHRATLVEAVKGILTRQVVDMISDRARGQAPVVRRADGLFGPRSVAWRVHGDVTSMLVGGVSGLLLQMLHPAVLAGVWDHSNFRSDMHGRLRRTARFIATTTYAGRDEAEGAIARVRGIHAHVRGILPDGRPYAANDPALLAWVHVTEATSFLAAWIMYGEPHMSRADQDRYFAEMALVAEALGAAPVPHSRAEADAIVQAMRGGLLCDERTRAVARFLLRQRPPSPAALPFQTMVMGAGIDILPDWARAMHGFPTLPGRPLLRAGTAGIARTLRWAFA